MVKTNRRLEFAEYDPPNVGTNFKDHSLIEEMNSRWDYKVLRYFQSTEYRVSFYKQPVDMGGLPFVGHLSYRRKSGDQILGWREKQLIKDCIAGTECEGVEIFPAWTRLLDTCNQYHMTIFPPDCPLPFGYFDPRCTEQDPELQIVYKSLFKDVKSLTPQAEREDRHNYIEDAGYGVHGLLGEWWLK